MPGRVDRESAASIPKTGKFTDFSEPTYGVEVDKDGNCWFSEYNAVGKIGKIDGKTLEVKTWNPPGSNTVYSRRIQIDSDGIVWFSQSGAGQIGRFDPKTETFKNYALPGPNASSLRDESGSQPRRLVFVGISG